jgi:kynurenine formamidase
LISVQPEKIQHESEEDLVITKAVLAEQLSETIQVEALIIRTLPNLKEKQSKNYSATNPPYISIDCLELLNKCGVKHLLIDLPSVDRESDGGKLAFHHGFWQVPNNPQFDKTITELIYVPDEVKDGEYLLNLQVAPFDNDAAPSRPVIFEFG